MPTLNAGEIAMLALDAGWSTSEAVMATAIALAESEGDTTARCHDCAGVREDSNGLWQVNVDAHPQYSAGRLRSDPRYNAEAAYGIYQDAGGFQPWGAFTNGSYQQYLDEATEGVALAAGIDPPDDADIPGAVSDAAPRVVSFAQLLNPAAAGAALADQASGVFAPIANAITGGAREGVRGLAIVGMTLLFLSASLALIVVAIMRMAGIEPSDVIEAGVTAAATKGAA